MYYTISKLPSRISMFGTKTAFRGSNLQKGYDEMEHDNRRERQNYFRQKKEEAELFSQVVVSSGLAGKKFRKANRFNSLS